MFSIIKAWLYKKAENAARCDLNDYISNIEIMPDFQVASILAIATHLRNTLYNQPNVDLLDPLIMSMNNPGLSLEVLKYIKQLQVNGREAANKNNEFELTKLMTFSSGLMVWIHTLRCGNYPALQHLGYKLWGILMKSCPLVEEASFEYMSTFGINLDIRGYCEMPKGLGG